MTRDEQARRMYDRIIANVEALYADEKTHEQFSADNRELWRKIAKRGLADRVSAAMRCARTA